MEAVKGCIPFWDNPRAIVYRRTDDIPGDWGYRCKRTDHGIR